MKRIPWNKGLTKSIPHPCFCGCGEFVKLHKYPRKNGGGFNYLVVIGMNFLKFIKKTMPKESIWKSADILLKKYGITKLRNLV